MNNGFILFRFSLLSLPASFFPPFSLSLVPSIEHRICGFFSFMQNRNKINGFSPQISCTQCSSLFPPPFFALPLSLFLSVNDSSLPILPLLFFFTLKQSDSFSTWCDSFLLQVRLLSKSPTTLLLS
ncbi:hypothetical protein I3842_07G149300 [Carya illinoinensis]|uniref:Secreted protein n=1 Tax=Carya illinoinensis TaxID=32201 RepID=A0A922EMK0_CARIL|nr:hypothetical protein I3842_07G149300 [Carya illinoinensis]